MSQNARKPLKKAVNFGIMPLSFSNRESYVRRTIQTLSRISCSLANWVAINY